MSNYGANIVKSIVLIYSCFYVLDGLYLKNIPCLHAPRMNHIKTF